jgi:ABC-2 type transport system ATP-binding protein
MSAAPTTCAPVTAAGHVSVRGLTRRFGAKVALASLDLDLAPGVVGLLGPNGSGKSTFMRCLTGLVPRDAGAVSVDGVELAGDGVEVRRRVTYAPGELHLYGEMGGREHLAWLLRGRDAGARRRGEELAADALGLPLERKVRGYSHGMKRQLCFAAALAPDVRVRVLDEPTEGLDPSKRGEILALLRADARQDRLVLLSSHHLGEVDAACERIVFLSAGRKIADESSADVRARAARVLRVEYPPGAPLARLARRLAGDGVESARPEDAHVSVVLTEADPRAFLARLAAARDLPAPIAIEHGHLSLRVLYRELYGVEGY